MALNNRQLDLKKALKQQLIQRNATIDYAELSEAAVHLAQFFYVDLTDVEISDVVTEITQEEEVILEGGGTVYDPRSFKKWLDIRRESTPLHRWKAYEQLLVEKDWSKPVIDDLDELTDEVVELLGDPADPSDMARRGLLLGEVQSGKTATYIGILNKAIDYGYRLIIVIGGHTNELRRQTQARMDSDLIGYDTRRLGENITLSALTSIGIAQHNSSIRANVLTTVDGDFSVSKTRAGMNWIQDVLPTVLVIKKNVSVIKNVTNYIKQQANGGRLEMPLVLIDDEADWGTPNIGTDTDPTRVNAEIRKLLATSRRSSYLGITATPFANVFIDHAAENEDLGQDLFPADYIRVMNTPSNYHGIGKYFGGRHPSTRTDVADCIELLPIKHKKTHPVSKLPESLEDAVMTFYLGTATRLIRNGGTSKPASMLINVSRFNDIQRKVSSLTETFVDSLNGLIIAELSRSDRQAYGALGARFYNLWKEEFGQSDTAERWEDIVPWLKTVANTIRVELVNSVTSAERTKRRRAMTADQLSAEATRPTIYVGGDVLARGLTLEGLQVSYFVREPRTMDTLMQMGRWFGYRPGYGDLIRLWMTESTEADFAWSASVAQEFRDLIVDMRAKDLTPRDFGLRVRAHPGSFEIVSARKRKSAELTSGEILIHGNKFESYYLDASDAVREQNRHAVSDIVERLSTTPTLEASRSASGYLTWRGVPFDLVEDFFTKFRADYRDPYFGFADGKPVPQIVQYLDEAEGDGLWDVVLVQGNADPVKITSDIEIESSLRNSLTLSSDGKTIEVGNRRVATATNLVGALTNEERESFGSDEKITESRVLEILRRPMLLLYALTTDQKGSGSGAPRLHVPASDPLIATVLAFPNIDSAEAAARIKSKRVQKFWVNTVWWNNMRGYLYDGDDLETGDEE